MPAFRGLADSILDNALQYLDSCPGVSDIRIGLRHPCSYLTITAWEQDTSISLPKDLAAFFLVSNGMLITWNAEAGDGVVQLGAIRISPLEKVTRIHDVAKEKADTASSLKPSDTSFLLDDCAPFGMVCLRFVSDPHLHAQIWFFATASSSWSLIATSFSAYFRLMVAHLGIQGWQMAYSDCGLSRTTEDWLCFYAPERAAWYRAFRAQRVKTLADKTREPAQPRAYENNSIAASSSDQKDKTADTIETQAPHMPSRGFSFDRVMKIVQVVSRENSNTRSNHSASPAPSTNSDRPSSASLSSTSTRKSFTRASAR